MRIENLKIHEEETLCASFDSPMPTDLSNYSTTIFDTFTHWSRIKQFSRSDLVEHRLFHHGAIAERATPLGYSLGIL